MMIDVMSLMSMMIYHDMSSYGVMHCRLRSCLAALSLRIMRLGNAARVLAKCILEYLRILMCCSKRCTDTSAKALVNQARQAHLGLLL